ncbi:MAG: hypothetical protein LBS99_04055, partial [Clostridiales bacterium]|nr:hypothetical protein [Clostridiales bacterium]
MNFLSETPLLVSVNGTYLGCVHRTPVRFAAALGEYYVTAQPLGNALPYAFRMALTADGLAVDSDSVEVIGFPRGIRELRLKRRPARMYAPPRLICQTSVPEKNGRTNVTLFADAYTQLLVEKETFSHTEILPDGLTDYKLKAESDAKGVVITVTAKAPDGHYIKAVRFDGKAVVGLLDEYAHKIEQTGGVTRLISARLDIAERAEVRVYEGADFALKER